VAFPNIRDSFPGSTISSLSWILNAYSIVFAAFLIVSGRIADLLGRRRAFTTGVLVFTFSSVLCAIAPSVGFLVGARVIQALGAAVLVPASLALVVEAFPTHRRSHAVGLWGASAALASGLGPPIGGALVQWGDWRWAFLVNLPFGLAALCRPQKRWSRAPRAGAHACGVRPVRPHARPAHPRPGQGGLGWTSWQTLACFAGVRLCCSTCSCSHDAARAGRPGCSSVRSRSATPADRRGHGLYAYLLTNILAAAGVEARLESGLAVVPGAVAAVLADRRWRSVEAAG
jgi:MFS family permease